MKQNLLKILGAVLGAVAIVTLCILSSRFSWFGTIEAENKNGKDIVTDNPTKSDSSSDEVEKAPTPTVATTSKATTTTATTVATTSKTTTTAATTVATTAKTTTTTATTVATTSKATTTAATTVATTVKTTTTAATTPKPLWTEEKYSGELYITVDCYSRKQGIIGAEAVSVMKRGTRVTVTAKTDTDYYKLEDGSYVHSDYLSKTKPAETTTTTVAATKPPAAVTTTAPSTNDTPSSSVISASDVGCTQLEAEAFNIVNEYRAQHGLPALKWDSAAYAVAKTRCKDIMQLFSHLRPNGEKPYTLYADDYFSIYNAVGENIAAGQKTARKVVDSWYNSTMGHRENLLSTEFENMAIALYIVEDSNDYYGYYWAQEFNTYK